MSVGEFVGWYGTGVILGAYALVSFGVIGSESLVYQLLNLLGALGIAHISFRKRAYQPGVLNIIWALVAALALCKMLVAL